MADEHDNLIDPEELPDIVSEMLRRCGCAQPQDLFLIGAPVIEILAGVIQEKMGTDKALAALQIAVDAVNDVDAQKRQLN